MKLKYTSYLALLSFCLLMLSSGCTTNLFNKFDDAPTPAPAPPKDLHFMTISEVKGLYDYHDNAVKPGGTNIIHDKNLAVKGRVISSDRGGNFYNSFFIQDATGGIQISAAYSALYALFPPGSEVVITLDGLKLGAYARQVSIGMDTKKTNKKGTRVYENGPIPSPLVFDHIYLANNKIEAVTPLAVTIPELKDKYAEGQLVKLTGVHFIKSELSSTWASPGVVDPLPFTDRTLEDAAGNRLTVHTSNYASFAKTLLPQGTGSIIGVMTYYYNFLDRTYKPQLLVSVLSDVSMDK